MVAPNRVERELDDELALPIGTRDPEAHRRRAARLAPIATLIETLQAPKFDRYIRQERRDALLERVASLVEIIDVMQPIRASHDPNDDKFLEADVNGTRERARDWRS